VAGEPGFEPRLTESESVVLPLNYSPAGAKPAWPVPVRRAYKQTAARCKWFFRENASGVSEARASWFRHKKNLANGPGAGNVAATKIERAPACSFKALRGAIGSNVNDPDSGLKPPVSGARDAGDAGRPKRSRRRKGKQKGATGPSAVSLSAGQAAGSSGSAERPKATEGGDTARRNKRRRRGKTAGGENVRPLAPVGQREASRSRTRVRRKDAGTAASTAARRPRAHRARRRRGDGRCIRRRSRPCEAAVHPMQAPETAA
jgi:hypothetical protein